jgi:hypothetical protein
MGPQLHDTEKLEFVGGQWVEVGECISVAVHSRGADTKLEEAARRGLETLRAIEHVGEYSYVTRKVREWCVHASTGTMLTGDVTRLRHVHGAQIGTALMLAHQWPRVAVRIQELRVARGRLYGIVESGILLGEVVPHDGTLMMVHYALEALEATFREEGRSCLSHEEVRGALGGMYELLQGRGGQLAQESLWWRATNHAEKQ